MGVAWGGGWGRGEGRSIIAGLGLRYMYANLHPSVPLPSAFTCCCCGLWAPLPALAPPAPLPADAAKWCHPPRRRPMTLELCTYLL